MKSKRTSLFHIIISSNSHRKFLTRVNQDILFNYMISVLHAKKCRPFSINGYSNHIHIVVDINPDLSLNQLVRELLQNSTDFLRRERSVFPEFSGWDSDFYSLTYNPNQEEELLNQIKNQFEFHRNVSFEQEISELFPLLL